MLQALVAHKGEAGTVAHYSTIIRDISARKARERQLHYQASYDGLTGAMNRGHFEEYLERELATARQLGARGAVAHFDLDKFKEINDSYGHHVGDEVLRHTARVLQSGLRGADRLARLGGDEFAVLLSGAKAQQAVAVGRRLLRMLEREPYVVDEHHRIPIKASMGVAVFPEQADTVEGVLICADLATYEAKRWGGHRVELYNERLGAKGGKKPGTPKQGTHWLWPV